MELTKISSKGQIVIPLKIRNELKITEGSIMAIGNVKGMVVLKKMEETPLIKQFEKSLEDLKFGRIRRVA